VTVTKNIKKSDLHSFMHYVNLYSASSRSIDLASKYYLFKHPKLFVYRSIISFD